MVQIGVCPRAIKISPIDSSRRELPINRLSVNDAYELILLRWEEVDIFFRPFVFFAKSIVCEGNSYKLGLQLKTPVNMFLTIVLCGDRVDDDYMLTHCWKWSQHHIPAPPKFVQVQQDKNEKQVVRAHCTQRLGFLSVH